MSRAAKAPAIEWPEATPEILELARRYITDCAELLERILHSRSFAGLRIQFVRNLLKLMTAQAVAYGKKRGFPVQRLSVQDRTMIIPTREDQWRLRAEFLPFGGKLSISTQRELGKYNWQSIPLDPEFTVEWCDDYDLEYPFKQRHTDADYNSFRAEKLREVTRNTQELRKGAFELLGDEIDRFELFAKRWFLPAAKVLFDMNRSWPIGSTPHPRELVIKGDRVFWG